LYRLPQLILVALRKSLQGTKINIFHHFAEESGNIAEKRGSPPEIPTIPLYRNLLLQ